MLDNPVAHFSRQKIDNRRMNFRWRGKRPAFDTIAFHNPYNLIGKLFMNAAVGLGLQLSPSRDRTCMPPARAVAHWNATSQISYLLNKLSTRVGDIACLRQPESRSACGRLMHSIRV